MHFSLLTSIRSIILIAAAILTDSAFAAEKEVEVINTKDNVSLAGTLAIPDSAPKAFLVLASGSGAQNRDEEVYGLRPFKTISDALVQAGYGVLRVDDRGVGKSTGDLSTATLDDLTRDADACVNYIKDKFPGIKTGILGHSQGGQVAIKEASAGNCDFIITLAGPAWQGDSLIMSQCRALAVAATGSWPNEALQRRLLDIAMAPLPDFTAKVLLAQELGSVYGEAAKIPQVQQQIYDRVAPLLSPMYREMLKYNPESDIKSVNVPWLALNGDKDLQVLSGNLKTIKTLNPQADTVLLPGLNHLFQEASTGLPSEYELLGQAPNDATITIIIDWLNNMPKD